MAGRTSRNKGSRGEREVIALLQPVVNKVCDEFNEPRFVLRRNQDQRWKEKQYDLIGVPWIALEVKRQENLSGFGSWWRQTLKACGERQTPVLIYRQNYKPWQVRMRCYVAAGDAWIYGTIDMKIEFFLEWFEVALRSKIRKSERSIENR